MNKKVCGKCGSLYDDNLANCPYCESNYNNSFNIKNLLLNEENQKQNNDIDNNLNNNLNNNSFDKYEGLNKLNYEHREGPKESIIFENNDDQIIEEKIEKINKKNSSLKRRKKKKRINQYFCALLLIQSMILLFIIILSSINDLNIPVLCHYAITSIVLMISFSLSYRNKELGIILSSLASVSMICMFIEGDTISVVIGVYILVYSFINLIRK